eukprot:570021-Alexandrium_andersonii.AAC.1
MNILKFTLPTDDGVEWALKGQKEAKELMPTLTSPMAAEGSKFVAAKAPTPPHDAADGVRGPAAKAAGKAASKKRKKQSTSSAAGGDADVGSA